MKKLSDIEKKASSKVLGELRSHAQSMMNDKMKGLKKVTVASNTKEGLKEGLNKAEEILGTKKTKEDEANPEEIDNLETEETEDSDEHEAGESEEYEAGEEEGEEESMSEEELDAKIKELMALKDKMKKY